MTVHNILEKHPRAHPSMACGDKTSDWSFTQSLKDLWKHLRERQKQRKQRRIDRDAFRSMIMLDETQLKDIGINREDVLWAANLPCMKMPLKHWTRSDQKILDALEPEQQKGRSTSADR